MRVNPLRPISAIQFAIDFAQKDLAAADLTKLSQQVRDFFVSLPGLTGGKPWHRSQLLEAQEATLRFLNRLATGGGDLLDLHIQIAVFRVQSKQLPRGIVSSVQGALRDRFLYRLIQLLEEFGAERLLVCPSCRRLFFKVTRKEFCSTRCQARVYMRVRRAIEKTERGTKRGKTTRTR